MKEEKNNKGLIIGLMIFFVICFLGSSFFIYKRVYIIKNSNSDTNNNEQKNNDENSINTFSNLTHSGTVRVKGYAKVERIKECTACENSKEYKYMYFYITETDNIDFLNYVNSLENSYAKENAIGLGCIQDDILTYINYSNQLGEISVKLTSADTNKLLNTSMVGVITLDLEHLEYGNGQGAPLCYSHITHIKFVD